MSDEGDSDVSYSDDSDESQELSDMLTPYEMERKPLELLTKGSFSIVGVKRVF